MHDHSVPPVAAALAQQSVPHRVFRHGGPVHSLEQAAAERGQQPRQIVRSILFRLRDDDYAMVLAAGPDQLSWRALRRYFGRSRITMAKADEVLAVTGYPIGAVGPFGMARELPIFIDHSVTVPDEISIGSGQRGVTVILRTADLLQALPKAEIADLRTDETDAGST